MTRALLAALALSSMALAPPTRTVAERVVPFKVGETLTYEVSWSDSISAGTATATVKEKKPSFNSTAYYIVVEGRPSPLLSAIYSLYYKVDTLMDCYTLLSQRGSVYSEEGRQHRFRITQFDRVGNRARFESQIDTTSAVELPIAPLTQDILSAIYALRARSLKIGDRFSMPVVDSGMNYAVQIDVEAAERVRTPIGEMPAWRLSPTVLDANQQPIGRRMTIWLSDDRRRLPLQLRAELPIGTFGLLLRDAR
jgi:hypothetical protein